MAEVTIADLESRLRLAHQSRRASEHQLDGIRRALCDAGFMHDDDPYGHADLADVIRQHGPDRPGLTAGDRDVCADRAPSLGLADENPGYPDFCTQPQGHRSPWHQGESGAKWRTDELADVCGHPGSPVDRCQPCTLPLGHDWHRDGDGCSWPAPALVPNPLHPIRPCDLRYVHDAHDWDGGDRYCCVGFPEEFFQRPVPRPQPTPCDAEHACCTRDQQPRPEPLTALGEARCQSQHRPEGGALVQCARAVHPVDAHTSYDSMVPLSERTGDLTWHVWNDEHEATGRG